MFMYQVLRRNLILHLQDVMQKTMYLFVIFIQKYIQLQQVMTRFIWQAL